MGWSDGNEDSFKREHFNAPFKNSTLVLSAWDNEKLVGCVRVLSDKITRSVLEDLAVLPEYQKQGIGSELLKRCIMEYPKSEWSTCTTKECIPFYMKNGFINNNGENLIIKSTWFEYKD